MTQSGQALKFRTTEETRPPWEAAFLVMADFARKMGCDKFYTP